MYRGGGRRLSGLSIRSALSFFEILSKLKMQEACHLPREKRYAAINQKGRPEIISRPKSLSHIP
jgi:hypothetical protein